MIVTDFKDKAIYCKDIISGSVASMPVPLLKKPTAACGCGRTGVIIQVVNAWKLIEVFGVET